jgi:hypothetical protein
MNKNIGIAIGIGIVIGAIVFGGLISDDSENLTGNLITDTSIDDSEMPVSEGRTIIINLEDGVGISDLD